MRTFYFYFLVLGTLLYHVPLFSQTLPGDQIVYGPMLSPVYGDSIRVWVMMKASSGSGSTYVLEVTPESGGAVLTGIAYQTDDRSGHHLRSYLYKGLQQGQAYNVTIKRNGTVVQERSTRFVTEASTVSDFEFLAGGCGRIFDMSRCIDQYEARSHINGTPEIYNHMATEQSDLMVWLGDAVYLLGLQHAGGTCPTAIDDWANKDACFDRYMYYRKFHDSLCRAMPQLAITDNHDTGPNEFNKDMPTLPMTKELFMEWWPNPVYKSNAQGQGLYSSYRYKDVEYFLLDNRSYRESTVKHMGIDQLNWLKQAMLQSTATFKVIISGTPTFDKRGGGRNFSITTECDELIKFVKSNNIDGVLSYSADIHRQEFYGRYNDHTYPFFDVLSGNLASDIGTGNPVIARDNDMIFDAVVQTYTRSNVYGNAGDRRLKIDYVSPEGIVYYGTIIHEDMLKSKDKNTLKLSLSFENGLKDSSAFNRLFSSSQSLFAHDRKGKASSALHIDGGMITTPYSNELNMQDRTFSITYWVKPVEYPSQDYATIFSNAKMNKGFTIGINTAGQPVYIDHASAITYTASFIVKKSQWSHVTWKYDNVKFQLMLYSNGQLLQRWSNVSSSQSSDAAFSIGNNFDDKSFNGFIDEFNFFGKLITDQLVDELSEYSTHKGKALSLKGAQNTVIPSAELNALFSQSFTIEFWSRLTAAPSTGAKLIACNGRVNNLTTGFALEFAASGKLNLAFGTNGSGWTTINEKGNAWKVSEWNHVALTAVKNDSLYLYINGVKIGTAKFTQYTGNTFGLAIGVSTVYQSPIQGEIDELRIWNTPQPQDSILKRMHYELDGTESQLVFYYDFVPYAAQSVKSKGSNAYELSLVSSTLRSSSAPVSKFEPAFRHEVRGSWSIRDMAHSGLSIVATIPDYESNVVIGKNTATGSTVSPTSAEEENMQTLWQIDALKLEEGTFVFEGPIILPSQWATVKSSALEFYLMKQDENGELKIEATGQQLADQIIFSTINLEYGVYTLGWKNSITGFIDRDQTSIRFYPNPSEDYIVLTDLKEAYDQIFLHDIHGQVIEVNQNRTTTDVKLDTSLLSPGMYVIVLHSKETKEKKALRFIKQ